MKSPNKNVLIRQTPTQKNMKTISRNPCNYCRFIARTIVLTLVFTTIIFSCRAIAQEQTYTKSASLPPIRITYSELQSILDKSVPLMVSANARFATRAPTEKVEIKQGELQVTVTGHQLLGGNAKLPKIATELN